MITIILPLTFLWLLEARLGRASGTSEPPQPLQRLWLRDANVSSTNAIPSLNYTPTATTTAAAIYDCDYHGQDPDLGIASPFCICGGIEKTQSWPLIQTESGIHQNDIYAQCNYTAAPVSTGILHTGVSSLTDIAIKPCLTCTSMGYYEGKCTSTTNCNTQIASTTTSLKGQKVNNATGPTTSSPPDVSICANTINNTSSAISSCLLQDKYCSLQGSSHALDGLRDVCVLWDSSCCGDTSRAAAKYWSEHLSTISSNDCFVNSSASCTALNPPGRLSAFSELKNWMRSPQCFDSNPMVSGDSNDAMVYHEDEFLNVTCCGDCEVVADQVDIYIWPDPLADTSCLSIVGDGLSHVSDGATTDATGGLYWGCTAWGASFGPNDDESMTIVRTASLTTIASIPVKYYLYNPWDASPCGTTSNSSLSDLNATMQYSNAPVSMHRRDHTLVVTNSGVSTTIMDNYTLYVSSSWNNESRHWLKAEKVHRRPYMPISRTYMLAIIAALRGSCLQ